ncbi:cupin domain-containing protein [Kiloniella antarctica]|uniref:Cupin domain-containing protein n=1 Tax=Kiloniella antarctica TaxID=1550907 RepID=A0ABW5BKJ5_9PROT
MRLNADFTQTIIVKPENTNWSPSPAKGVERIMLDRIGEEVARATTIVRFAKDKYFPEHQHDGGEEFFVLEGVFSDQYGDFPAGTYVRNPVGTSHSPHTVKGCIIFVKLWQFDQGDDKQFSINTNTAQWISSTNPDQKILPLHHFNDEIVQMEKWASGSFIHRVAPKGGVEILVLEGSLQDNNERYPQRTWLRYPEAEILNFTVTEDCTLLCKSGHLPNTEADD